MRFLIAVGTVMAFSTVSAAQDLSCTDRYCKDMTSCQEAVWRFDHCGASKLDRDSDGLPCENLCKTADTVSRARKANAAALPDPPVQEPSTATDGEK